MTRDQTHLSWFHQIFREIEQVQSDLGLDPPLVNLHVYLTGLKQSSDIRGAFLQLAFEMVGNPCFIEFPSTHQESFKNINATAMPNLIAFIVLPIY